MSPFRLVTFACLIASAVGCVSRSAYNEKQDELRTTKTQLKEVGELAQNYGSQVNDLESRRQMLERENQSLRSTNEDAARRIEELRLQVEEMSKQQIPNVEVVQTGQGVTFRVNGSVLFDPGDSALKPSGRKTIEEVGQVLLKNDYKLEIAGHTDSDPVTVTKDKYPNGNIELGADRALAVWNALKQAGVPANRMSIASYGEHAPIGPDKSKNRRVEIRVMLAEPTVAQ